MKTVQFPDGTKVPAIGQGSWCLGESAATRKQEIRALQLGIDLGMTLIDTAEMYADGGAEEVIGEAIAGQRQKVFLVSKVYPHNAGLKSAAQACEQSLQRLKTDYLDLYLLHWRGNIQLSETIEALEKLRTAGKILRWGVSNLNIRELEALWRLDNAHHCMTNQVLYHLGSRGIEFDLLPWCRVRQIPVMAYCPLAQAGRLYHALLTTPILLEIAAAHHATPVQILLAWVIRENGIIAIPKAVQEEHVRENAAAGNIVLRRAERQALDQIFPPPVQKVNLEIF
jgi:diketogulonate reductase-like aldo/keto reductase